MERGRATGGRAVVALAALLALLSSAGCEPAAGAAAAPDSPARATVLLLDVSGSASAPALRARSSAVAERVAATMAGGDWVAGDAISAASLVDARLALDVRVAPFSALADNRRTFDARLRAARDTVRAQTRRILRSAPAPCTDVLGGLQAAAKVLAGARGRAARERRLVVASDMVETCRRDVARSALTDAEVAALVAAEHRAGRLPDLRGVEVWVAGAGTGGVSAERARRLERLWTHLVAAAGGRLASHHYGGTLLDWPE